MHIRLNFKTINEIRGKNKDGEKYTIYVYDYRKSDFAPNRPFGGQIKYDDDDEVADGVVNCKTPQEVIKQIKARI